MREDINRIGSTAALTIMAPLALLSVVNSFLVHLTPDAAIALLNTRTFLETFSRYAHSYDSKGLVLTLLLAPAVSVFGATMAAGAATQLVGYAIAAALAYRIIADQIDRRSATVICALWFVLAFSPWLWGGRVRAEDFMVCFSIVCLYAGYRGTDRWLVLAGAVTAMAALTKSSFVITCGALCVTSAVARQHAPLRAFFASIAGFMLIGGLALGWIVLHDDFAEFLDQTILLPGRYWEALARVGLNDARPTRVLHLIHTAKIDWLVAGGAIGVAVGWLTGKRRLSMLVGVCIAGEGLRMHVEGARWNYLPSCMVLPSLLGTSLLRMPLGASNGAHYSWLLSFCVCLNVLPGIAFRQVEAFEFRAVHETLAPTERLAIDLAPFVQSGDSMLPSSHDCSALLLLDARYPYRVLPHYFGILSEDARRRALDEVQGDPPTWVIVGDVQQSARSCRLIGSMADIVFAQVSDGRQPDPVPIDGPRRLAGATVPAWIERMLITHPYELVLDTGCQQAWRRVE